MEQSILKSTKKVLNVAPDDDSFDLDITTHINSAFSTLNDLGVGPQQGFAIEGEEETWEDFLSGPERTVMRNHVKDYVAAHARLRFDPPTTAYLLDSLGKQIAELTFRISVKREETDWVDPDPPDLLVVDGGDPSGET